MNILLSWTSFLPRYGGPAYSVSRLALGLATAGASVAIWAPDGSATTSTLIPLSSPVRRLDGSITDALQCFGRPDILHDNGIWLPHNHALMRITRRERIPRMVSLRGMLEPWAVNYKKWKKKSAWWLYQRNDLKRAEAIHVTSDLENNNARRYQFPAPIYAIPNGIDVPEPTTIGRPPHIRGRGRTALFLSRIHPKKGLSLLVEAWAWVRPPGWRLKIAGPDEVGHRRQIEELVRTRQLSDTISLVGEMGEDEKRDAFSESDLFILPSHSENFGIVVVEALAHGLPVLTTTGTPWSALPLRGCGWCVDATVDGIAAALREATSCSSITLNEMGARGREWIKDEFAWDKIAAQFLEAYAQVLVP